MEPVALGSDSVVSGISDNEIGAQKGEWKSLPIEIKQKIIKCLPIIERFRNNSVDKQWKTITNKLNRRQTKLVLAVDEDYFEVHEDANSVCNLASHTFDRTCILSLCQNFTLDHSRSKRIIKNFPCLVAIHVMIRNQALVETCASECVDLEHLSFIGDPFPPVHFEDNLPKITCLDGSFHGDFNIFPNLKYYTGDEVHEQGKLASLLKNGLRGHAMQKFTNPEVDLVAPYVRSIEKYGQNTEVVYDFDFQYMPSTAFERLLARLPKLTTIYGRGTTHELASLVHMKHLTNLAWNGRLEEVWLKNELRDSLSSFGHRLRSLRIGVRLHPETALREIVETCPYLEHLRVHQYFVTIADIDSLVEVRAELVNTRNSFEEYKLLTRLTKLKTCEIDWRDVDDKFLRMLDVESVELKEMCKSGEPMSIKNMIRVQHEIMRRELTLQVMAKKVLELESQMARRT